MAHVIAVIEGGMIKEIAEFNRLSKVVHFMAERPAATFLLLVLGGSEMHEIFTPDQAKIFVETYFEEYTETLVIN
jgi:hypothetical protein